MKRDIAKLVVDGFYREALNLYTTQHHSASHAVHSFIFPPLIKACTKLKRLSQGQMLHNHIIKTGFSADIYASTSLVDMYIKLHLTGDAVKVFNEMPQRTVAALNAVISGFSQCGYFGETVVVFNQLGLRQLRPNSVTIASLLSACDVVNNGEQIHCWAVKLGVESDTYAATSLVTMYSKCADLVSAKKVFEALLDKNVVSYNAFLSGLLQNGFPRLVVDVFNDMRKCSDDYPNSVTLVSALSACAVLRCLCFAKQVHGFIMKVDKGEEVLVGTALVDMYSKCGCWQWAFNVFKELKGIWNLFTWNSMIAGMMSCGMSEIAVELFEQLECEDLEPDSVTWNSMIIGFSQLGKAAEAFRYFRKMQATGAVASPKTITSLLPACSDMSAFRCGKEIHGHAIRADALTDEFMATAVIDMYMKCGQCCIAQRIFDRFEPKPEDSPFWNAMISGYGRNGQNDCALQIFYDMLAEEIKPNSATFVSVLSACSHSGQVDKGLKIFKIMVSDYEIQPKDEHLSCIIDLLGRSGRLGEARELALELGEPSASVFSSLLGACMCYLDPDLGEEMVVKLLELEPDNAAPLVMLSNIYAAMGNWREVERIRDIITDKRLDKLPGFSLMEAEFITSSN